MSSDGVAGARFLVRGRVQGVGFRWWTQARARELGLVGTVRNLADGAVEVHAFGSSAALAELGTALASGPPAAAVTGVEYQSIDGPPPSTFEID